MPSPEADETFFRVSDTGTTGMARLEDGTQHVVPQDLNPAKVEDLSRATGSLSTTRVSSGVNRRHQAARLKRVALQFLSNIYMYSETVQEYQQTQDSHVERKSSADATHGDILLPSGIILAQNKNQRADKVSIRLRGKKCKYTKRLIFPEIKIVIGPLGSGEKMLY